MAMERIINLLEFAFGHPRDTGLTFSYRFRTYRIRSINAR